jgi:hypothetical protein
MENTKNEKKYMGNKGITSNLGKKKKGKGNKWKNGILKVERKIKRNGKIKEKGNECEPGKE